MKKVIGIFLFFIFLSSCGGSSSSSFNTKKFAGRYKVDVSPILSLDEAKTDKFGYFILSMFAMGAEMDLLFYEKGDGMLKCNFSLISLLAPKVNQPYPFQWCITKDSLLNFYNDSLQKMEPSFILRKTSGTYDFITACDIDSHEPLFMMTRQN